MNDIKRVTEELASKEKTSAIVWLVVGILQVLSGVMLVAGIWNIVCSTSRFKQAKAVLNPWPNIVNDYDKWQNSIIICLVINILFGGVIGVIGCIFDFMTRSYVMENRQVFYNYFNPYQARQQGYAQYQQPPYQQYQQPQYQQQQYYNNNQQNYR